MSTAQGALAPATRCRRTTVTLPGTCGEWVQGTLDGVPCLVSCPIDWYGSVSVEIQDGKRIHAVPAASHKAAAAIDQARVALGEPEKGVLLRISNPLPRARGYASSTVDVAGAILAMGEALGKPFAPAAAARLAVTVEPSDSIMFPELTLLAHRDVAFFRPLGPTPPLSVVVIDPGGAVDTLAFNRIDHTTALKALAAQHREAFDLLAWGLARGDRQAMATAGTMSALAHQALLPNPLVEAAFALARRAGGLGIVRAHSGTIAGIICEPESSAKVAQLARQRFPACIIRPHHCL